MGHHVPTGKAPAGNDHDLRKITQGLYTRMSPGLHYGPELVFSEDAPKLLSVIQTTFNRLPKQEQNTVQGKSIGMLLVMLDEAIRGFKQE